MGTTNTCRALDQYVDPKPQVLVASFSHPDDWKPLRPIPISERLPKPYDPSITSPQDCDSEGRCWTGSATLMVSHANGEDVPYPPFWELRSPLNADTHWLPFWAIPLPEIGQ